MSAIQVHYADCPDYQPEHLQEALKTALLPVLCERGGAAGKSVMIKPNLLEWKGEAHPVTVHPALLVELCRLLKNEGASRIAVIENPAVRSAPAIIEAMGIAEKLSALGVEVKNCADYRKTAMPRDSVFRQLEIAREYQDFDLVIDFAKAKTHGMMVLTLAVKNLFGLIRGSERLGWHLAVGRDYRRFADLLLDIYTLVKPQISLLDAVVGMEGNGPGSGEPVHLGFIACSADALALDAAVSPRLGVDDLLLLQCAAARKLLPEFQECGKVPEVRKIALPGPPEPSLAWGVYFPPKLKKALRRWMTAHPVVDPKRCIGCGRCAEMCPPQSLKMKNGRPHFDLPECIRCYCCQEHCPAGAIRAHATLLMRAASRLEQLLRRS